MPEFRTAFHSSRTVREAAVTRVAVQLGQLEEVLISGASAAWPEQLLLDEPPNPRRRAVAKVLGSLGDRERSRRTLGTRHARTSNATTSWPVLARRRDSSPLDDCAPPISRTVLRPIPSCVSRFQPQHSISLFMIMIEDWCNDQIMKSDSSLLTKIYATRVRVVELWPARPTATPDLARGGSIWAPVTNASPELYAEREARDLNRYDNACVNAVRN
jgi:hypothetical protein